MKLRAPHSPTPISAAISGQSGLTVTATVNCNVEAAAEVAPLYEVTAILYDPPGNASSNGFADGESQGTTTSLQNNFSTNISLAYTTTDKTPGGFSMTDGVAMTWGQTSGNADAFTAGLDITQGNQLKSAEQTIDHTQDEMFVLLNPAIWIYQTGPSTWEYTPSLLDASSTNYGDVLNSNIEGLQTPSLMGVALLEPQNTGEGTYPGFDNICANPLPPSECTQANACGCTPSDFATIVAQDPMVGIGATVAPTSVRSTRYVNLNEPLLLQGPQQQGSGADQITYSVTDSSLTSTTESQGQSYSVGFEQGYSWNSPTIEGFGTGFSISNTNTFTWTQTQSYGQSNGVSHSANIILGTSNVGC